MAQVCITVSGDEVSIKRIITAIEGVSVDPDTNVVVEDTDHHYDALVTNSIGLIDGSVSL